jgi:hypothetical protein
MRFINLKGKCQVRRASRIIGQLDPVAMANQIKEVGGNLASLVDTVSQVAMGNLGVMVNQEVTSSQEDMASKVGTLVVLVEI